MLTVYIFLLGAIFGSFVNALVWRVHNKETLGSKKPSKKKPTSITTGRSVCESCGHELSWQDLIPVFSWLSLGGKCRYCKKSVSIQNPLVEVATSLIFGLSYLNWPLEFDVFGWLAFAVWLVHVIGLMTLLVYDVRWLLLPNSIVYPLLILAMTFVGVEAIFFDGGPDVVRSAVLGLAAVGGFFYLLFQVSGGRWIGGGDVKLGFLMGILLGLGKGVVALYVGFVTASVVMVPLLVTKRIGRKQAVPFGPFLILGIFIAQIWGQNLIDWYSDTFLYGLY